jgi:hypothetical protein
VNGSALDDRIARSEFGARAVWHLHGDVAGHDADEIDCLGAMESVVVARFPIRRIGAPLVPSVQRPLNVRIWRNDNGSEHGAAFRLEAVPFGISAGMNRRRCLVDPPEFVYFETRPEANYGLGRTVVDDLRLT